MQPTRWLIPLFAVLSMQCCPSQSASLPAVPAPADKPATRAPLPPSDPVRDAIIKRLGVYPAAQIQLQQQYLAEEGPARRGRRFAKLANTVETTGEKPPPTEYDVLILLGTPDYGDADPRGSMMIYLFSRFGERDWYVQFNFDAQGQFKQAGWNATSTINLTKYKRFPEWRFVPDLD